MVNHSQFAKLTLSMGKSVRKHIHLRSSKQINLYRHERYQICSLEGLKREITMDILILEGRIIIIVHLQRMNVIGSRNGWRQA